MAGRLEEPAFDCVQAFKEFEVRLYADTVQARVRTSGRDAGAASTGFRRVAGYIFGGNTQQSSIAMTAPVSMWEDEDGGWLAFTMPSKHSLASLPAPNDPAVNLVNQRSATVAVMKFSGRTSPAKTQRIERRLRTAMEREGLTSVGPCVLAVYDNPWTTLPFRRRNEVHIEVVTQSVNSSSS